MAKRGKEVSSGTVAPPQAAHRLLTTPIPCALIADAAPRHVQVYESRYRSVSCTLTTSKGHVINASFMERSGGAVEDWAIQNMYIILISFPWGDDDDSVIAKKIRDFRNVMPGKPIIILSELGGRHEDQAHDEELEAL